jgi:ubiquinone/menaquinone biosynthesis C-methylase UbiE
MTQELPLVRRLELFDRFYSRAHSRMVSQLDIGPDLKALDVGCGAGGFTALLAMAITGSGALVALDPALEHLARAREIVEASDSSASRRVVYCTGDIENLQFLGGEFDFVWCSRVVHHYLPRPVPAMNELYRVLRPGGRLALRETGRRHMSFSIPELGLTAELPTGCRTGATAGFKASTAAACRATRNGSGYCSKRVSGRQRLSSSRLSLLRLRTSAAICTRYGSETFSL